MCALLWEERQNIPPYLENTVEGVTLTERWDMMSLPDDKSSIEEAQTEYLREQMEGKHYHLRHHMRRG